MMRRLWLVLLVHGAFLPGAAVCRAEAEPLDTGTSIAFAPDGKSLAIGALDGRVLLWDCRENRIKATLVGHEQCVTGVAYTSDGVTLISGSEDGTIRVWDARSGAERRCLRVPGSCESEPTFSKSNSWYSFHFRWSEHLANPPAYEKRRLFASERRVFPWPTVPAGRRVGAIAMAPDGATLAAGYDSGVIRLWDVASGELKCSWQAFNVRIEMLAFAPGGGELAACGGIGFRTWDAATHATRIEFQRPESDHARLAYSPDGKELAASDGTSLSVRDAATGAEKALITGPKGQIDALVYHPRGDYLLIGGLNGIGFGSPTRAGAGFEELTDRLPGTFVNLSISKDGSRLAYCVPRRFPRPDPAFDILPLR